MRSLERSHGKDLDQADPEHMRRESAEFSWDDLKNIPFGGNKASSTKETPRSFDSILEKLDDSLLSDEERRNKQLERDRKKIDDLFKRMEETASFGRNARKKPKKVEDAQKEFDKAIAEANRTKGL